MSTVPTTTPSIMTASTISAGGEGGGIVPAGSGVTLLAPPGSGSGNLTSASSGSGGDNMVMNDKVQALAGSIYEEFESMMTRYDADCVKALMPLIVNVLENLDLAYTENQELEVEVELLKEDNEQLVTQYEREKQLRKGSENRLIEVEDQCEGERKEMHVKVDSLTSIVKMFELKAKNSGDHISRLEDKENEMKKEYTKLHERYTELFKTHIDYMERTKSMLGSERMEQLQGLGGARNRIPATLSLNQMNRSSGPVSFGYSELENNNSQQASIVSPAMAAGADFNQAGGNAEKPTSLKNELQSPSASNQKRPKKMIDKVAGKVGGWMDGLSPSGDGPASASQGDLEVEEAEDVSQDPSIGAATPITPATPMSNVMGVSQTKSETRTGNTLYQELSFHDSEAIGDVDEGADITDNESEGEESKDRGFDNGMGKEVENLITENNELLATKNALNIVKDDLIAKVDELTGEHEILREEIKSLQNIRSRLEKKTLDLEDELKKVKDDSEKAAKAAAAAAKSEDDEDVPMAQRKRFTRVEMARVLMERNQYKERFMELQEAVRWTEMIRAAKEPPGNGGAVGASGGSGGAEKKSQRGIWKFFGNLFSGPERAGDAATVAAVGPPYVNMKYSGGAEEEVGPALSTMRAKSSAERKARAGTDLFDGDTISSDKAPRRWPSDAGSTHSSSERKEQYKQVRAHVKKDDGRMQAYGWSLPAKTPGGPVPKQQQASTTATTTTAQQQQQDTQVQSRVSASGVPVPVPVYCRPLMEKEPGMKIWCAAGVNLSGGRTRDGGDIVGASVFYHEPPAGEVSGYQTPGSVGDGGDEASSFPKDPVKQLDDELAEGQQLVEENSESDQQLSSRVWICTSTHAISKVTVIDANSPADVLESFHVCSSHLLCVASVPGAKESDYRVDEQLNRLVVEESQEREKEQREERKREREREREKGQVADGKEEVPGGGSIVGSISFVSCSTGSEKPKQLDSLEEEVEQETPPRLTKETAVELASPTTAPETTTTTTLAAEVTATDAVHRRLSKASSDNPHVKDGLADLSSRDNSNSMALAEVEKMSSVLPTMWLGSQSGSIYVHSAVAQWKRCIHSIRLKDSVLSIVHVKGRVLAALADGSLAIFHRCPSDGQWDLTNYHLLDLGKPHHSIRCMVQVHNKVWCGYRNRVYVIDPQRMRVEKTFDAHPRKESQVRQMAWVGDGVWVSIRLDSTLRLYNAHTHEHLQDVDIEPYVSKMLGTGKLGFSFVRITALLVSNYRLWMGTGNGVIISVPLNHPVASGGVGGTSPPSSPIVDALKKKSSVVPGDSMRLYTDAAGGDRLTVESFVPYCNMAQAQLSFHGHRDAVKFFVSVPGHGGLALNPTTSSSPVKGEPPSAKDASSMLVMSGGEGYIDFRIVDDGSDQDYDSHIMVWQLPFVSAEAIEQQLLLQQQQQQDLTSPAPSQRTDSSRASSSLGLGPTPGSGVLTVDSEGEEEAETASEHTLEPHERLPDSFVDEDAVGNPGVEYGRWNEQVESMLENADGLSGGGGDLVTAGAGAKNSRTESLRRAPSPAEDFTQQIKTGSTRSTPSNADEDEKEAQ